MNKTTKLDPESARALAIFRTGMGPGGTVLEDNLGRYGDSPTAPRQARPAAAGELPPIDLGPSPLKLAVNFTASRAAALCDAVSPAPSGFEEVSPAEVVAPRTPDESTPSFWVMRGGLQGSKAARDQVLRDRCRENTETRQKELERKHWLDHGTDYSTAFKGSQNYEPWKKEFAQEWGQIEPTAQAELAAALQRPMDIVLSGWGYGRHSPDGLPLPSWKDTVSGASLPGETWLQLAVEVAMNRPQLEA